MTDQRESGFSIIEMLMVMAIGVTLCGFAMMASGAALTTFKARGVLSKVQSQVVMARELAISQQRDMRLDFTSPNVLSVVRLDKPSGTTTMSSITFEGGLVYTQVSGAASTTPDAWGVNTANNNGTSAVMIGDATTVQFRAGTGQLVNPATWLPQDGRIFVGVAGKPETAGFVSIFGATGRIRMYHWEGQWVNN